MGARGSMGGSFECSATVSSSRRTSKCLFSLLNMSSCSCRNRSASSSPTQKPPTTSPPHGAACAAPGCEVSSSIVVCVQAISTGGQAQAPPNSSAPKSNGLDSVQTNFSAFFASFGGTLVGRRCFTIYPSPSPRLFFTPPGLRRRKGLGGVCSKNKTFLLRLQNFVLRSKRRSEDLYPALATIESVHLRCFSYEPRWLERTTEHLCSMLWILHASSISLRGLWRRVFV